ncbi:hypothetical protein ACLOJK_003135 [Asimina triloba]
MTDFYCLRGNEFIKIVFDKGMRLGNLKECWIEKCDQLESLCSGNFGSGSFSCLKHLYLQCCPKLINISSSIQLKQLELLEIKFCGRLENVLLDENVAGQDAFPKLVELHLWELGKLKRICSGYLPKLKKLKIPGCPLLKQLPLKKDDASATYAEIEGKGACLRMEAMHITGTEAMFADLRHFTVRSIQISMCSLTFPCLVLAYAGQASYLREIAHHILYTGQCFAVAVAASIIASQAMISSTFSIIQQSLALGCFPLVKIVHSSSKYEGQTYDMLMTKFVATSDIDQMEATLKRLEDDPKVIAAWEVYSIAVDCYKKVGILDKAVNMLKKSEAVVPLKQQRAACEFLLSRYSGMGLKDDVYRLWNLKCSISKKVSNASYICMLASLSNLDDIEGAEKVPNQLVVVYCKKGQFDKADSFIKRAIEGGRMPYPSTWEYLATGYINSNQIPKGLEMMKKAISDNVAACLADLSRKGDVEGAEELSRISNLLLNSTVWCLTPPALQESPSLMRTQLDGKAWCLMLKKQMIRLGQCKRVGIQLSTVEVSRMPCRDKSSPDAAKHGEKQNKKKNPFCGSSCRNSP